MDDVTRSVRNAYEKSEHLLGRSWSVWVFALILYAGIAFILLTKINLPSPAHLIVYTMAAVILTTTVMRVEWGTLGLVLMIPFARPGFTIGELGIFHVSAFNVAVIGVWLVYLVRYFADRELAAKGPLVRSTRVDRVNAVFLLLVTIATAADINYNTDPVARALVATYFKEQCLYLVWFYLVVTLIRKPADLRLFALLFSLSGLLVAAFGLYGRITGAIAQAGMTLEDQMEAGVAGGRTGGVGASGWFGLGHPNLFAAFLLMTMPFWLYGSSHFKRFVMRLTGNVFALFGLVALLYTYARSAWGGIVFAVGALGLREPKTLVRLFVFLILFAIIAQFTTQATVGMGVIQAMQMRFSQLATSNYSARPEIFASALQLVRQRPLLGVGMGTFAWHGHTFSHAHNVFLAYMTEVGLPAAATYIIFIAMILWMAVRNLRTSHIPGYGFLAQACFVSLFAVLTLSMFDHLFFDRNVGYAFYTLIAMIVSYDRMVREGLFPGQEGAASQARRRPSPLWSE